MYQPKRDERFEYVWEVISFVEEMQCRHCAFSKLVTDPKNADHANEYPMCYEIEAEIISEEPVEALDDAGRDGVVCTKYKNVVLAEQEHPDQLRLI